MFRSSLLVLSAALLAAPALAETRSYDLKGFSKIDVSTGYEVEFTQGPNWSVSVDSKYGDFDIIRVRLEGDTLRIDRPTQEMRDRNRNNFDVDDTIHITAPSISDISISKGVTFSTDAIKAQELKLNAEAGTSFNISGVSADKLDVDVSAGSKATLAGDCRTAVVDVSAGSSFRGLDLKCGDVDVRAVSASTVRVRADDKLKARANSVSTIRVSGKPTVVDQNADKMSRITLGN